MNGNNSKRNIDTICYIRPFTQKEKIVGYFTNLNYTLKKVVKNQTIEKKSVYTIKEYITELETTLTNLKNLISYE